MVSKQPVLLDIHMAGMRYCWSSCSIQYPCTLGLPRHTSQEKGCLQKRGQMGGGVFIAESVMSELQYEQPDAYLLTYSHITSCDSRSVSIEVTSQLLHITHKGFRRTAACAGTGRCLSSGHCSQKALVPNLTPTFGIKGGLIQYNVHLITCIVSSPSSVDMLARHQTSILQQVSFGIMHLASWYSNHDRQNHAGSHNVTQYLDIMTCIL